MAITVEVHEGIAHLVLDDPPLNILTAPLMKDLRDRLRDCAADRSLRVLVLSAAGKHFSAGASVEEHLPGAVETMIPEFMATVAALDTFPAPVVVAIQGRCLGGALELALAGDLLVAGRNALLGVPEISLGVFPPAACVQLPRLASPGLAAELVLTGKPITAAQALEAGLVRRVVEDEAVVAEAMDLARAMSGHSAAALREAKKALRAGVARDGDGGMAESSRIYLEDLMQTADATEGLRSFVEKRRPQWSHS
jgi:cyclohexa-1,5-dienecarbonyl-CoA hydratase